MTNSKNTKRALLMSILSMMLCMAMLVGSTFAWFTDSVTSSKNKIVAGNLDVELYHANGKVTDEQVGKTTNLFTDKEGNAILWEPGVMVYENFTVKNVGSLALKYCLTINAGNFNTVEGKSLKDVLKVAVLDGAFTGNRAAAQALTFDKTIADFEKTGNIAAGAADNTYAIVIYWEPTSADNDYNLNNGKVSSDREPLFIDLGVNLVATQYTEESDSFGNDYDKKAEYTEVVTTVEELDKALDKDGIVKIVIPEDATLEVKDKAIIGKNEGVTLENRGTLTLDNATVYSTDIAAQGRHAISNYGTLTVKNSTIGSVNSRGNAIRNYGTATVENSTLTCCDNYLNGGYAYVFGNTSGTLTVNNCNYEGAANGVFGADGGDIIVNGGTYKLNGKNSWHMFYLVNGTITINDGIFEKSNETSRKMANKTDGLTINGGSFTYNGSEWSIATN